MTAGDLDSSLFGRIVRPADYVRVLATPLRLRSPHFAVHHLDGRPLPLKRPMARMPTVIDDASPCAAAGIVASAPVTASLSTELSTGAGGGPALVVDDPLVSRTESARDPAVDDPSCASGTRGPQRWLGLVVPKRHAKRAVTRTLVKRQIRNVAADCAPLLEPGLWVVRQRSPFDPKQYPSAASDALKEAARAELRALFERAVRGERDRVKPRSAASVAAKGGRPPKAGQSKAGSPAIAATPIPTSLEGPPCAA